ncbi:MAG: GNAT family N-acetyltransferase [Candidatus Hodarchaeota archaeon]
MEWFRSIILRSLAETLDLLKDDESYIHMRLPIERITKKFETNLKRKIDNTLNKVIIREATKNDVETFIQLHKHIWMSTTMPYKPFSKDVLKKLIEDPNVIFLIAKINNKESGFGIIHYTGEKNQIGVISALGIVPDLQHKGFGTILGLEIWNYFKKKGLKELRCRVSKENKNGYLFIKSLGFEEFDDYIGS